MKTLFRSIRHKLLNEGKLLRYLSYAVGEVILIIVGILFALKINDYNEDRKAQVEFDAYVVQLREDVTQAISFAEYRAERAKDRLQQALRVLQFLKGNLREIHFEDIEGDLDSLGRYSVVEVDFGNLSQLLDGDLSPISRDKDLYKQVLVTGREVKRRMATINEAFELYKLSLATFAKYLGRTNSSTPEVQISYNAQAIKDSEEFVYAIQNLMNFLNGANYRYTLIKEELESFLTVLEEYE